MHNVAFCSPMHVFTNSDLVWQISQQIQPLVTTNLNLIVNFFCFSSIYCGTELSNEIQLHRKHYIEKQFTVAAIQLNQFKTLNIWMNGNFQVKIRRHFFFFPVFLATISCYEFEFLVGFIGFIFNMNLNSKLFILSCFSILQRE